ncbi:MAG: hypothetical protein H0X16_09130 [Chloroflexi bacterium]|nr:hypothetical protein [Chloroflexota bacterium]
MQNDRRRPISLSMALGVAALIAVACSAGAVPTVRPSPAPTGQASGSPAPSDVVSPSDAPGASGAASPVASGDTAGAIDHPTDAESIVLRMEECCGFVPITVNATQAPSFTLYGDGRVIYRGPISFDQTQEGLGAFRMATMTEAQVQQLLSFALEDSGLADARERYENDMVADAPTTIFSIDAGGITKSVSIVALGLREGPDAAAHRRFSGLAESLRSFEAEVERGNATDAGIYEPEAYRAVLIEAEGMQGEVRDWPFRELAPEDFVQDPALGFRIRTLTPEEATELTETPVEGVLGINVTGPDRKPYTISLRPILPDEER